MAVYEQFWGLTRAPFVGGSHPDLFFRSESHQASLLKMRYVVENCLGAAVLAGSSGLGKTFLIDMLKAELSADIAPFVRLVFPLLSPAELMTYLAVELGADESDVNGAPLDRTVRLFERSLQHHCDEGRHPVIVIDDAHLIPDDSVFQALQLLLNFHQPGATEFSLFLLGEPTLLGRIERLSQFEGRMSAKAILQPLDHEETAGYISRRLEASGCSQELFDESAVRALFEISGGTPRRINQLCDLALLIGYADRLKQVSASEIEAVAEELVPNVPV